MVRSVVVLFVAACSTPSGSDAGGNPGQDASTASLDGGNTDAGLHETDSGVPAIPETEPNNASTTTEVNAVVVPARVRGAIDPADDMDVFSVQLVAGETWRYELTSSASMAPHFGMVQDGDEVPRLAASGPLGATAVQEHFVLRASTYYIFVRDARNVPAATSQQAGGPDSTWTLSLQRDARSPTSVTFPSSATDALPFTSAIHTYTFEGTLGSGFDIVVNAARKDPPSDMDSRLSLFHSGAGGWLLTNDDDAQAGTIDSHIGGDLPHAGTYVVILENVNPDAQDLSYEISFAPR